ncbi:1-phosphatidylinositol-3-phosphate 5-kinase [Borealophlyctis nickersoniae]|nr:1-phosphatidylinositol-3-phosphate 5-kinase [Borealophlyctis nickersoniae]
MSDYGDEESTLDHWDVPSIVYPSPITSSSSSPRPSLSGQNLQVPLAGSQTSANASSLSRKNRQRSASPETQSAEGFKRIFASSRFTRRGTSEEFQPDGVSSPVPFRGSLDDDKSSVSDLTTDLMDPEIAAYMTEDEEETLISDSLTSTSLLNHASGQALSGDGHGLGIGSLPYLGVEGDPRDPGHKTHPRMKIRRSMRGEDLRQQFTREKMKRRSFSNGQLRPTKFSGRGVGRKISRSTLVSPAESMFGSGSEQASASQVPSASRHKRSHSAPPFVELNSASLRHMRRLLRQVLLEAEISASDGWEDVIMNLMLKVCDNVQPDVRAGDDIDIRHYVKIKKIPGGVARDCQYVHGVVCSKNVAHKKMVRPIRNPKILLLTFALEYQRVENQFLSLEPLLSQEREHLKNLVARVIALQPDLVLVEKTVSRLALEFLLEANVAVAYNVKPSVLEALARCTRADIISSIDKLALEPRLGTCELFAIKTFMHRDIPGFRKTFLYFEGCPKELGCTLVLRGANTEVLAKLKQITDLMVFVVYNLKLETYLFRDQYALSSAVDAAGVYDCTAIDLYQDVAGESYPSDVAALDRISRALRLYQTTILSASPHVRFPPPYLLVRMKEQEQSMASAQKKQQTGAEKTAKQQESVKMVEYRSVNDMGDFEDLDAMFAMFDSLGLSETLLSSLETRAGISYLLESAENLSPFGHQSIMVLYSNICSATTVPCQAPEQHLIEYYRGTDMTLGQYLEELCFNSDMVCPSKLCERKMLMHFRSYAHWQGRVNVIIEEHPCLVQGMEDTILMWSVCRLCGQTSPFLPMSEETWKFSFGKYLELAYYCPQLPCRASLCAHNIHRDHIRYFGLRNLAVRFEYDQIDLLEVSVPAMRLRFKPELNVRLRQNDAEVLRDQITRYFDSISERIKNFTYEIVAALKIQTCKEVMNDMGRRAALEKKYMLQLLQQTLISSAPTDMLALNAVLRTLTEKVASWDADFAAFVRNYLQSDPKEIRRMTAAQIRRMFADRDAADRNAAALSTVAQESPVLEIEMDVNPPMFASALPALGKSPSNSGSFLTRAVRSAEEEGLESSGAQARRRMSIELMKEGMAKDGGIEKENSLFNLSLSKSPILGPTLFDRMENAGVSNSPQMDTQMIPASIHQTLLDARRTSSDEIEAIQSQLRRPSIQWLLTDEDDNTYAFQSDADRVIPLGSHPAEDLLGEFNDDGWDLDNDASFARSKGEGVGDDEEAPMEWNTISGVATEASEGERPTVAGSVMIGGERTSIMKTITNLWTGNAANFLPLEYPTLSTEHFFPDSLIVVREDEPSSIIAFTLNSKHYKEKLQSMQQGIDPIERAPSQPDDSQSKYSIELDDQYGDIEETLLRGTGTHIRYQFWDGPTRMNCKIFFAEQFDALRRNCGCDETYVQSLARCIKWEALGGKSGSAFLKTRDDRMIVKQLSRLEMDALYKFAPAYFEYMSQAFFHELPTVLAKIFGFYRISFKNPTTGRSTRMDILVMENLFYERNISRIFDLKGSMRNRHVQSTGRQNEVLLDENLVEFIYESPLFIREHSKKLLRASVWNDTLFLSKLNVMDYSLVVGIDAERNELVVGIVDFIRTFTWDKKLESWVKETAFLGGGGKEPTIVSPRQYKNRFREAMERYFLMVTHVSTSPHLL